MLNVDDFHPFLHALTKQKKIKPYYMDSSKNGSNVYNTNAKFASPFNSSFYS
jgi:hypothetical protein